MTIMHRAAAIAAMSAPFSAAMGQPLYHLQDLGAYSVAGQEINKKGEIAGTFQEHAAIWTANEWKVLSQKSDPTGVSNNGTVVGTKISSGESFAITWKPNGQQVNLVEDAQESYGTAASPNGTIYGVALPAFFQDAYPFAWRKGTLTSLPKASPWPWTVPKAANDSGQVVGYVSAYFQAYCPDGVLPAIYSDGAWTLLKTLGGQCAFAVAINKSGTVVGSSQISDNLTFHPFVYEGGVMSDLGFEGEASGINDAGDIVGSHLDAAGKEHPWLLKNGSNSIIDLDAVVDQMPPNGDVLGGVAINDRGEIVVQGVEPGNVVDHVYLLTPL